MAISAATGRRRPRVLTRKVPGAALWCSPSPPFRLSRNESFPMTQVMTHTLALVLPMLWAAWMLYPTSTAGPFCAGTLIVLAVVRLAWGISSLRRVKTAFPIEEMR